MTGQRYQVLAPDIQIEFYYRLRYLNDRYLLDALKETVSKLDIRKIDDDLSNYVDPICLKKVASFGIRGEIFFPVPYIIEANPKLLGYYRLLLGISQKNFYSKEHFSGFKPLEDRGKISSDVKPRIEDLCTSLVGTSEILIREIDMISLSMVRDLQLLTLGGQLRGGINNKIGEIAKQMVFDMIRDITEPYIKNVKDDSIEILNDSNRKVIIKFSGDPDISITETIGATNRPLVAIEIKGGYDYSNIYNRLGEAEKSHQTAKDNGFTEFWTIIRVDVDINRAKIKTPTTNKFFNINKIQNPDEEEYHLFRDLLSSMLSIQIN